MSEQPGNREFPNGAADRPEVLARRDFVKLLGASAALAGLGACVREPDKPILPYVDAPSDSVPGVPRHYATAMTIDGYATGLLVESHDGRPTKVEGNPDHPASLGAAGIHEQASVLELYDPHRASAARAGRRTVPSEQVRAAFSPAALARRVGARGAGLRLLLEPTSSPLIATWLDRVHERYPDSRAFFYAPLESEAAIAAARAMSGSPLIAQYDLTRADVVLTLDADPLASGPFHLRLARDFSTRRRAAMPVTLFVAEPSPTPTGTMADQRLRASPSAIGRLAAALVAAIANDARAGGRARDPGVASNSVPLTDAERSWINLAVVALTRDGARSAIMVGERQPAEVHVMAHALNAMLGNLGHTVWYTASPIVQAGEPAHDINVFASEVQAGDVDTLIVLEGNPCYSAPANLRLAHAMRALPNTLYLGLFDNETAGASTWQLPAAHFLETWGDTRAYDGTESIVQPLIAPLYGGMTVPELLATLGGSTATAPHELLREAWRTRRGAEKEPDRAWNESVRRGIVDGSALPRVTYEPRADAVSTAHQSLVALANAPSARGAIEIVFAPSHAVYDGRFADNAWLQELPDPITKLTWDNAALMSPEFAARSQVESGDVVELRLADRVLEVPALIVPGQADETVSLAIGYGRAGAEAIARGVGANANALRESASPHLASNVRLRATGRRVALAVTQDHWSIEGRGPSVIGTSLASLPARTSAFQAPRKRRPLTLYEPPAPPSTGFGADQWAMTIDLDQCTGCSACVIACQAENNVPVVGKEGVLASREMHWMRIDRYLGGTTEEPTFDTQPMLCQHCEKAPCEYVCPVNATVHSDDGLNEMVYNRCVGTRFCSNNCPYKVRRFNWFDYNDDLTPVDRMLKNPQVTVRARGVMEKCTFCVQRVRRAQMDAELAGAPHTGPVQTACQQSCPSQAIVFGSLTAPDSEVARLSNDPRAFSALAELGTVPRVRYLARQRGRGP